METVDSGVCIYEKSNNYGYKPHVYRTTGTFPAEQKKFWTFWNFQEIYFRKKETRIFKRHM